MSKKYTPYHKIVKYLFDNDHFIEYNYRYDIYKISYKGSRFTISKDDKISIDSRMSPGILKELGDKLKSIYRKEKIKNFLKEK